MDCHLAIKRSVRDIESWLSDHLRINVRTSRIYIGFFSARKRRDEMRDDTSLCHVAMYRVPRAVSRYGIKACSYMILHFTEGCIKLRLWLQLFDT